MKEKNSKPYALNPTVSIMKFRRVIGRNKEIVQALRLLQGQSISVEEIRRMGKTLFVQKLAYKCNNNLLPQEFENDKFKAHYFFLQGIENLGQLIDYLIRELEKMKAWYKIDLTKTYNIVKDILKAPTFTFLDVDFTLNLPEHEKHWKEVFSKILEDIADNLDKNNTKLILILDELPIMLWEWYKKDNHLEAINLLDILREKRQTLERKGLRFIFCGSIGMKVILNTFRLKFGYTGEATNEMEEFSLNPFKLEEVTFLCDCYTLSGFEINEDERQKNWNQIFKLTNGIPFYVSKIFNILQRDSDKIINTKNIKKAYTSILEVPTNHSAFKQLLDRIDIYYSEPTVQAKAMKTILNYLSNNKEFVLEEDIINSLDLETEETKSKLYILFSDHYIVRKISKGKRHYKFKYEIFRQWWKINIA